MSVTSYVFAEKSGSRDAPLVFTFHGTGGDEGQFTNFASELLPDASIISPRGDVFEQGAARFFKRTGEGVYDMDDLALRTKKMTDFIRAHKSRSGATRVVGMGYSNGANILASVMFKDAGLFDAAILMHPLIPFQPQDNAALKGQCVLITAGRNDLICPAPMTRKLAAYFTDQGTSLDLDWHEGGHELRPSELDAIRTFLSRASARYAA